MDQQALAEYRYRAVREVLGGSPIGEVAARYGTSRQSLHAWRRRFESEGMPGLADRSRRPRTSPARLAAEVEALICQLRREHPRWGARRIVSELGVRGGPVPGRATVHRVLARNGLVNAQEQEHKRVYKRWQRQAPMHLWQLDLVGGVPLADGREAKMVTGIDDHSRFVVIAVVVAVPTGRAVCDAFSAAMRRYGVPFEVLSDNGKQFTGRHMKPQPVEVLFERICRENGITQRLTKPRTPTTTRKIERWHKTLRRELLDDVAPFESLVAAQEAVDGWVQAYNHARPHQSLGMATRPACFGRMALLAASRRPQLRIVIFCWLAFLLIRVAENHTGQTWPAMCRELQRIHIGTFTGPVGTFRQRTGSSKTTRDLLTALKSTSPARSTSSPRQQPDQSPSRRAA